MKVARLEPQSETMGETERRAAPPPRPERTFAEVLRASAPPAAPAPTLAAPIARLVERVGVGEARVDALLEAAARGKTFTPAELIAMQAEVFRHSQTVEVLSRGADKLVGAVKQALGTQV
jgi:hypothetical protein